MIDIERPSDAIYVADWVEFATAQEARSFSRNDVAAELRSATNEDPDEVFLAGVWRVLYNRSRAYSVTLFRLDRQAISPVRVPTAVRDVYVTCLILALKGNQTESAQAARLFEMLAGEALRRYLDGNVSIVGAPPHKSMPTALPDRIQHIADILNEKTGELPRRKQGDRGVDVVAWKSFGDGRSGQVVVLMHCAAGKYWDKKILEMPLNSWRQYIHWAEPPVRAFAVPVAMPEEDWHQTNVDGGMVFDRIRLVNLLSSGIDTSIKRSLRKWVSRQS